MAQDGGSLKYPANAQPIFSSRAYASPEMVPHPLGTIGWDHFGRRFRFVKNGGTALVVGNAIQSAAEITQHQAMTPAAAAIGDKSVTMTPGNVGGAADLYADGILVIDTTPGEGYAYPVKGHLAIVASTAFVINLYPGFTVQVALDTNSRVNLYPSPYRNVIQYPVTTASGTCVGCAQYPLAISEYGWIGDNGAFGSLIAGTPAIGAMVTSVGAVAGALSIWSGTLPFVGTMIELGVNTKIQGVQWRL